MTSALHKAVTPCSEQVTKIKRVLSQPRDCPILSDHDRRRYKKALSDADDRLRTWKDEISDDAEHVEPDGVRQAVSSLEYVHERLRSIEAILYSGAGSSPSPPTALERYFVRVCLGFNCIR